MFRASMTEMKSIHDVNVMTQLQQADDSPPPLPYPSMNTMTSSGRTVQYRLYVTDILMFFNIHIVTHFHC
jgi:hypothetical protein